jgi:hypothetical protein
VYSSCGVRKAKLTAPFLFCWGSVFFCPFIGPIRNS